MGDLIGIPSIGWIAISIWLVVNILPWTYSLYFIYKINKSGIERWGAKKVVVEKNKNEGVEL